MGTTAIEEARQPVAVPTARVPRFKGKLALMETIRQEWVCYAAEGETQDLIRHPDYFGLAAPKLRRHDLITVFGPREEWEVELVVERVLVGSVYTAARKNYGREGFTEKTTVIDGKGDFFSEYRPSGGWCIIRAADGHPVITGHAIEANAIAEWRQNQPRPVV